MFYTREGLQKLCEDLKVNFDTLNIEENENYKNTTISGVCREDDCVNEFSLKFKPFRRGAKCSIHLPKYDIDFLREYCDRYEIKLTEEYTNVTRKSIIKGQCINCTETFEKNFRGIVELSGAYCEKCTKKIKLQKVIQTNIRIRNVPYVGQDPVVKEKMKQTNLATRGFEYASQDPTVREKIRQTNLTIRGVEYPGQDPQVKEKAKQTNMEKRGVPNAAQDSEVKEKIKQTNLIRYGTKCTLQNSIIKEKTKQTLLRERGVVNAMQDPNVKEKVIQTNIKRRGVPSSLLDPIIQEKIRKTNLAIRGVPNPSQDPEVQNKKIKSSFRKKKFIFPSGKEIYIQGDESYALNILLEKYKEKDIETDATNVPTIWWLDSEEKSHRHYVDIYIPKIETMIEVKSDYTFTRDLEKSLRKQDTAQRENYSYEIWVFNKKKRLTAIIYQTVPSITVKWFIRDQKLKETIERGAKILQDSEEQEEN